MSSTATSTWTDRDISSQNGKLALVTGANSGIGYHTALELARAGATVVLAGRGAPALDKAVTAHRRGGPRRPPWRPSSSTSPTCPRSVPPPERSSPSTGPWTCWSTTPV